MHPRLLSLPLIVLQSPKGRYPHFGNQYSTRYCSTLHSPDGSKCAQSYMNWEVSQHPLYSPDLSPRDFHAFSQLKGLLKGWWFYSDAEGEFAVNHKILLAGNLQIRVSSIEESAYIRKVIEKGYVCIVMYKII